MSNEKMTPYIPKKHTQEVIETIFAVAKAGGVLPIHVVVDLCCQDHPTSLAEFVYISMECKK